MEDGLTEIIEQTDEAGKWLGEFFKNSTPSDKDFKKARIATSHRATMVRAHAAVTARERVRFTLAKAITEDSEALKKYLEASTPKA